MTHVERIADLDALPAGSAIEILDKRGSVRRKDAAGDWTDAAKPAGTTWNTWTYVNTRRYGARVIERNTEVSTVETTPSLTEQLAALVAAYQAREDERERVIASFEDEEGGVLDSALPAYDETVDNYGHAGREDLVELLGKLIALLPA
ncbi:hypothetical protein KME66_14740 [Streptomyces sp. YPW6]|uniref:hypothetical protein n=1 Tax=Streptomyces sp. YPW6 TaxID=2840373 RepID=UPI001C0D2E31|nr:hypothetical protein [Streptomyces sp. YPW6]QWQ42127.1 hypothetical protein KME66_14740 [Streptomyces sp. YPW6]